MGVLMVWKYSGACSSVTGCRKYELRSMAFSASMICIISLARSRLTQSGQWYCTVARFSFSWSNDEAEGSHAMWTQRRQRLHSTCGFASHILQHNGQYSRSFMR